MLGNVLGIARTMVSLGLTYCVSETVDEVVKHNISEDDDRTKARKIVLGIGGFTIAASVSAAVMVPVDRALDAGMALIKMKLG